MFLLEGEVIIKQELVVISVVSKLVEVCLVLLGQGELVVHGRIDGALTEELFVNVTHISLILNTWLEYWVNFLVQQSIPVKPLKEYMLLNLLSIGL